MESEQHPTIVLDGQKARKRSKNVTKREQEKLNRYKQKALPISPKCVHPKKSSYQCSDIKAIDANIFAKQFYSSNIKIYQDQFILKYSSGITPRRQGKTISKKKQISIEYYVRKSNKNIIRVCKQAFCSMLGVGRDRVIRIAKTHLETGRCPKEKRGDDKIGEKNIEKKTAIRNFIKKFKIIEIHYCRNTTAKRQYLPSELNIKKMYQMFLNEVSRELHVEECFFRNVKNTNFNIGFKTPATDLCSKCIMLAEKLKLEKDAKKKQNLMVELLIHKRRAKAFFQMLKEERSDLLTISFDCQKNMTLPKVADQAAYYSRQFYMYNFGVVVGSSKSALTKNNVFLYPWTDRFSKGSVQIASAVNHCLRQIDLTSKTCVRLFADGCGGQNKNSIMIGMCCYWLLKESPHHLQRLEVIFPITGHSYIPPDRVFGRLEKIIKNKQTITKTQEYIDIYESVGTVFHLGDAECPVKDWKSEAANVLRAPATWHFKFNEAKRFVLTKSKNGTILVRGEIAYKSDAGVGKCITKKGKKISKMNPIIIKSGVKVAPAKIKDVQNLLKKHFGVDWLENDSLIFYKQIIDSDNIKNIGDVVEDTSFCESQLEFDGVRI